MTKIKLFLGLFICFNFNVLGQNSAAIYHQLQRLNFLGSVLYVGAHPDDENTRMIGYFANHQHARTAYLSLTRGDGGQNLIGTELRESLGAIRTQELIEARKIDGGEQFFTLANDFGYSKNPEETLSIWNREELLQQVTARIRSFRPDIVINRFDHRTPGQTHGHHTTSAMMSFAAFDTSNDTTKFPENDRNGKKWQPKRLFYNTSWWAYGSPERFEQLVDKTHLAIIDVGAYDPLLGLSNATRAANSRSQHKSQGFGSSPSLGANKEYLELIKGAPFSENPFDGIDTSWNRVEGGKSIGEKVNTVINSFDFTAPNKSLPLLIDIYQSIQNLKDTHWKNVKSKEVLALIEACGGWYFKFSTEEEFGTPKTNLKAQLQAINPTAASLELLGFTFNGTTYPLQGTTRDNTPLNTALTLEIPNAITTPYWLIAQGSQGNYVSPRADWIGQAKTPALTGELQLKYKDVVFTLPVPLTFRQTDPIAGEVIQDFHVLPEITVAFSAPIYMMPNKKSTVLQVQVTNHTKELRKGVVQLQLPKNWQSEPKTYPLSIAGNNTVKNFEFEVFPDSTASPGTVLPEVVAEGTTYNKGLQIIAYPHIQKQFLLQPTTTKVVPFSFEIKNKKIGYIQGAGDKIPESLTAIGIQVDQSSVEALSMDWMQNYPTLILGIRSFNVAEAWEQKHALLMEYVRKGGNVIVQYNTSRGLKIDAIGPYPLQLSRNRVTDENAAVQILDPKHPLFNYPNPISAQDFEGWVQERGLYFANQWDAQYTPLLAMNDPNEAPMQGSLLLTKYGKGSFIFTGLSFFRQLPAGVPGAYRLFANMISYE